MKHRDSQLNFVITVAPKKVRNIVLTLFDSAQPMLCPPPSGTEDVQHLAAEIGCTAMLLYEPYGTPKPALLGSFSSLAVTLKEFGGRWHRTERVYAFASWPLLAAALQHVKAQRLAASQRVE